MIKCTSSGVTHTHINLPGPISVTAAFSGSLCTQSNPEDGNDITLIIRGTGNTTVTL